MKSTRSLAQQNPRKRFSVLRSLDKATCSHHKATALLAGSSLLAASSAFAVNTPLEVNPALASQTALSAAPNLAAASTYTSNAAPTATSDVLFSAGTYTNALYRTTGATNIGTLNVLTPTAITIGSSNAGTAAPLVLNGGGDTVAGSDPADLLYVASGSSLSIVGGGIELTLGAVGNIDVAGTLLIGPTTATTAGTIINGTNGLTKTGVGAMTIVGAAGYSGGTTISAGTLQLGNGTANGSVTGDIVDNAALILTNATAQTLAGNISGSGTLTKNGAGLATLSGTNTYTGGTTVSVGTLEVGFLNNLPNSGAGTTVASGATLALAVGANINDSTTVTTLAANASFASGSQLGLDTAGGNFTYTGGLTGALGLSKLGGNTLVLNGANTYTGTTTIGAGNLQAAGPVGSLPTASAVSMVGATTLSFRNDTAGTIAQGNNITITSSSTATTIDVANNGGATTGSTVQLGNVSFGTAATATGGTLNFTGANGYVVGINTLALAGDNGSSNGLNPTTASVVIGNITNQGTRNTLSIDTLTLGGTSTGNAVTGVIANATGNVFTTAITKNGAGTWTLSGASTYTGATVISAGTLSVNTIGNGGTASSVGASGTGAANLILNGGTLQYTGAAGTTNRVFSLQSSSAIDASGTGPFGFTQTASAIGFNSGVAAKTLTLTGSNTSNNRINAVIGDNTGATSVTKSGTGTWVLAIGANTYTGATTVNAGTLVITSVAAAAATGAVNVNGGALMGTGTTPRGLLTVATGANLAPGTPVFGGATSGTTAATPGVLTVGALTLSTGSNLNILLNEGSTVGTEVAGTNYSQVSSTGAVTLAGNLNLNLGVNLAPGDKFFILQNTSATAGGTTGTFANITGTSFTSGYATFTINYADTAGADSIANDISLTVTAVPEPTTWAGGLLSLGMLGMTQRRRVNAWLRMRRAS